MKRFLYFRSKRANEAVHLRFPKTDSYQGQSATTQKKNHIAPIHRTELGGFARPFDWPRGSMGKISSCKNGCVPARNVDAGQKRICTIFFWRLSATPQ